MNGTADNDQDTIVAPATPPGKGAVGIVRLSGPDAARIGARMLGGELPPPRVAERRNFLDNQGRPVDSGIVLWFPAPASFTGESVLELQGHGGPVVMSLLIETAVTLGARRAEPGEFSRRAFLNRKLDLSQAEAIADLIDAGSNQAARAAFRSLQGEFSQAVHDLVERLTDLRMHVEAAIDFPDEEIDFLSDETLLARLDAAASKFEDVRKKAAVGRVLCDGYRVVILGRPNAGKSSLLNRLADSDAAIVTEIAGTTRDILRETIDIEGLQVELVDTAGLREDPDRIEAEGIRRARKALDAADAVLWVTDATLRAADPAPPDAPEGTPVITVHNKVDLTEDPAGPAGKGVIAVSALTGAGIPALRDAIRDLAGYRDAGEGAFTARRRHLEALTLAEEHFRRGREALADRAAGEILAEELRLARAALGAITGELTSDELLGRIFAGFCIGK